MLYLRSRLNISLLAATAIASVAGAALFGPLGRLLIPLGAVTCYLAFTVAMLPVRRGSSAIVAQGEAEHQGIAEAALCVTADERDRIGDLRITDPEVRSSVLSFMQVSGEYLEAARRSLTYSPQSSDTVREVLELLRLHLERGDGAPTDPERRSDPARTAGRIREAAREIEERLRAENGAPGPGR